ncbi:unnamed protein product [Sympodiomycopsis kandeliae]
MMVIAFDDAGDLPADIAAALRRVFAREQSPIPSIWLCFVGASPVLARLAPTMGEAFLHDLTPDHRADLLLSLACK